MSPPSSNGFRAWQACCSGMCIQQNCRQCIWLNLVCSYRCGLTELTAMSKTCAWDLVGTSLGHMDSLSFSCEQEEAFKVKKVIWCDLLNPWLSGQRFLFEGKVPLTWWIPCSQGRSCLKRKSPLDLLDPWLSEKRFSLKGTVPFTCWIPGFFTKASPERKRLSRKVS